jgi:hypothetical protein
MNNQTRSALFAFFGLLSLIGAGPAVGFMRDQSLNPDSMPRVGRGATGSISFDVVGAPKNVIKQFAFYAPEGITIVGIRAGKTGQMPPCKAGTALPGNYVTCVASAPGLDYFETNIDQSISIDFAVDTAATLGVLSGKTRTEQRRDGEIRDATFGINVEPTLTFNNELNRPKRQLNVLASIGVAFFSMGQALIGWHAHTVPLNTLYVKLPPQNVGWASYAKGTPGELGSRYSAVGKLAAYDATPLPGGGSNLSISECSGVVVPSKGKNVIMTAAHCLVDVDPFTKKAAWRTRLAFCPGMTASKKISAVTADNPISCPDDAVYNAVIDPSTGLPKAYINSIWADVLTGRTIIDARISQYDLAFVELAPNAKTKKMVEQVHGSHNIAFNLGFEWPQFMDLTLARNVGYNGGSLDVNVCNKGKVSSLAGNVNLPANSYAMFTMVSKEISACNMKGGISGGPWLANDFEDTDPKQPTGVIFGVNAIVMSSSTKFDDPLSMWTAVSDTLTTSYTPSFRDWALGLYRAASGIAPTPYVWGAR